MRKDMGKVIVQCYRHAPQLKLKSENKKYIYDETPVKESMKKKYHSFMDKEKNDRLAPFNRFLMKKERENSNWDDVHSEVRKSEGSKLIKNHLLEHFYNSCYKGEDGKIKLKRLF
jgi:hypothetical protein